MATIKCDQCKHEFSLSAVKISEAAVDVCSKQMALVYFLCPYCGKLYRITLKDGHYAELQNDLESTKKRIRKNNGCRNLGFTRMLDDMVRTKAARLKNYADQLNKKFPGTFEIAVSENNRIIKYYHECHGL